MKPVHVVSACTLCLDSSLDRNWGISNTNRRCSVAAGDGSSVKRHVSVQAGALVATLLVRVAGASLVAVLDVDRLRRLVVGAPAFLVLEDSVGEFALAVVVAQAKGLIDVLT